MPARDGGRRGGQRDTRMSLQLRRSAESRGGTAKSASGTLGGWRRVSHGNYPPGGVPPPGTWLAGTDLVSVPPFMHAYVACQCTPSPLS